MKNRTIGRSREMLPFVATIVGAAIILLVTLLLPLGFDNDLYESMGWTLYAYHGLPYIASWDHNFPGIVFVHWASIALFGASDFGFRLFDYLVHVAMAGFFYRVLRTWLSQKASMLAVFIFVLYYASGQWGLAGQRDTYAAFLLLGAVFAFVKLKNTKKYVNLLATSIGILCGATFLMRPTYVFFAIAFLILLLGYPNKFKTISFYLAGCVVPIIAFLLPYMFVPDGLLRVYNTLIRFNLDVYSSVHVPINLWSRGRAPIFVFAAVGLFFAFRRQNLDRQDRAMFFLLTGCALISPIMMGKYFTYHFEPFMLLAIPFAALALHCLAELISIRFLTNACLVLALSLFIFAYYPRHLTKYYFDAHGSSGLRIEATYEQVLSDSLYGLAAQRQVVQYVDRVSAPQDSVEYVSIFPGLRWRLQRPPASHFTSVVPLAAYSGTVPSYGVAWRREFLQSLEQVQPRIVIISRSNQWWPFVGKTNDSAITCIPGFDSLLSVNYTLDTMIRGLFTLPHSQMKAHKVLDWLVYATGGAYVLLFLFSATLRLIYPYEVEWNEGAVLDHAIRALAGKPIYAAPTLDFAAFVYTPLYYYLTALLMKIGGVGLWSGRLISILSTLMTAIIAGRIVRRETHSSILTFSSIALYIAFYHITGFFYDIVRMDALAILFLVASVYAALYFRRGYLIAALFAIFAYFTKQQMIFIVPAIAIGLAFRNKKQALWFSILSFGLIVLCTFTLNWMTNGWYRFYTFAIPEIKAAQSFSWITAIEFFPKWVFGSLGFVTLMIFIAIVMNGRRNAQNNWPILLGAFLMALISSAISIGNSGGYQNVFIPLTLIMAILFPISIYEISKALPAWPGLARVITILAFLSFVYNPLGEKMLFASARQRQAGDEFIAKLKTIPGDVWIPFHGYIGSLAGKPTHVHFMAMNDALVPHDSTSARFQREIDSSLAAHRFSAIILDEENVFRWDSIQHYERSSEVFRTPNVFLSRIGEAGTCPDYIYFPSP